MKLENEPAWSEIKTSRAKKSVLTGNGISRKSVIDNSSYCWLQNYGHHTVPCAAVFPDEVSVWHGVAAAV